MPVSRVGDAQVFDFLISRGNRLRADLQTVQEQIASGKRLTRPEQDPVAAGQVVRLQQRLGELAELGESTRFGTAVLGAEDDTLGEATSILTRAREIATQQATDLLGPAERAAAREEVRGLIDAMTALGNTEFAGRRVFGGLAQDAPPPFADPQTPGWTAATAYVGSQQEFSLKVGSSSGERVRLTTRGDNVFGGALAALEALDTALGTNAPVAPTLTNLESASETISAERASVAARQADLLGRQKQMEVSTLGEENLLSSLRDADLATSITQLTQLQTALQALLAAGAEISRTSLVNLLTI
jgi:flagellar hook-associated protein 3 FlgL